MCSGEDWSFIFSLSISKYYIFLGFIFLIIFWLKSSIIRRRPDPTVKQEKFCLNPLSCLHPQYDHLETETWINPYDLNRLQLNGGNWTIWNLVLVYITWKINMGAVGPELIVQGSKCTAITIIPERLQSCNRDNIYTRVCCANKNV